LIDRRYSRSVTIGDCKRLAQAGDFDRDYPYLHENEVALTEAHLQTPRGVESFFG
jgi:hypothetical protein